MVQGARPFASSFAIHGALACAPAPMQAINVHLMDIEGF